MKGQNQNLRNIKQTHFGQKEEERHCRKKESNYKKTEAAWQKMKELEQVPM